MEEINNPMFGTVKNSINLQRKFTEIRVGRTRLNKISVTKPTDDRIVYAIPCQRGKDDIGETETRRH